MGMKIIDELCTRCGECLPQCHLEAISVDEEGRYVIDQSICNECEDLLDVQCARVCRPACIVDADTLEPVKNILPQIPTLRPDHLLYLIAVMGTGNSGRYTLRKERVIERSIIARAYLDPQMKVRIVPTFDACCLGCPRKRQPRHRQNLINEDTKTAGFLGFEFGQVINFWDAVDIARQKMTPEYLKSVRKPDVFIKDFMNSISPYDTIRREYAK